ncbi:MAG: mycothiol synthase [Actinomycetota bacterium]|nr:mycothiol synthase [Actinomycetota bacterium]
MRTLSVKRQLDSDDLAAVHELLAIAERVDGHRAVDEHRWLDMAQGGRTSFAGLVAWQGGHDHPVGYAQVSRGRDSWALDLVVDPHHRSEALSIGPEMLRAAIEVIRREGGGHVHLWVYQPSDADDEIAAAVGLRRGRELLQMRRPLPLDDPPPVLELRPFRPGDDDQGWLEVNNRAFASHPEQGGWDLETLAAQMREPWFDPAGFLLHEREGRLAGFCWTKVHADHDPPLGELYVVAVDPDFQGSGLGHQLALAGLHWLHDQRGLTAAMLYVDAANRRAVGVYEDLGFVVNHTDRAYVGDVAPS